MATGQGHALKATGGQHLRALVQTAPEVFWFDQPDRPIPVDPLRGTSRTDLAVVGGGYTGLWSALRAKERDPDLDVILLEADVCGGEASGRNGGFCAASLTHGFANGMARWPSEMPALLRLGRENLAGIGDAIAAYGIDCDFTQTGELDVATASYQADELAETEQAMSAAGCKVTMLDQAEVRAEVRSPTYLAGLFNPDVAIVDPARLAWGLRDACLELGVRICEGSPVRSVRPGEDRRIAVSTPQGAAQACRVILATNAQPVLRRTRLYTVPVYDYALATEPLSADQLASVGWANRQGVGDSGNLFHYYRLTPENRIVWGGYDAIYPYASRMRREHEQRPATFAALSRHFFETFPQLEGLRFTHRWGGVIDTCTRFCAFFGVVMGKRVAYAAGFTGLGVGSSRFAADVMLDLLGRWPTERTELEMVQRRPLPFPPEPFRYVGIGLTRWSLARADANDGKRNLWLTAMDKLGFGFDS
jgi:glycine/D-amino acid oxidase-like deaminating enzyme